MKIVVIDGQGGSIGKTIIEQLKKNLFSDPIIAIGTNSIATLAMLKAGADFAATGENPILVACEDADILIGPMGILAANSLLGEITPAIAVAVGKSKAEKILIPSNKCKITVAGMHDLTLGEAINQAVQTVLNYKNEK